jgi:hypothetical protein
VGFWSIKLPEIDRLGPFKVVIYFDDHEPAHVHVIHSSDCVAVINISVVGSLELREVRGNMKVNDVKRALRLVHENQEEYLKSWHNIHGGEHE